MVSLDTAREIALALPEAVEQDHFGRPSFRVKKKIFATLWPDEKRMVVKLPRDVQAESIARSPKVFAEVPGTWGYQGATFIELRHIQRAELVEILKDAWRRVAPKLLAAAHGI